MTDELTYCRAGGPPDDWRGLIILCDGLPLSFCIEANALEGFAVQYRRDVVGHFILDPDGQHLEAFRVEGRISIKRPCRPENHAWLYIIEDAGDHRSPPVQSEDSGNSNLRRCANCQTEQRKFWK